MTTYYSLREQGDEPTGIGTIALDKWDDWATFKKKAIDACQQHFDQAVKSIEKVNLPHMDYPVDATVKFMDGEEATIEISETWMY